jgi:ABC-type branched-subunit amino acid transport system substrate-binding protein
MPRYQMSDAQLDDLLAYLRIIGTPADSDPGIGPISVKVGAALPLTGPIAEIGKAIAATLRACFDQVNAAGGIYGRSIELFVEDVSDGPTRTLEATRHLIDIEEVFALVASFEARNHQALDELIASAGIPSIRPIAQAPREAAASNADIWYLLPTFADQARVLVDYARAATHRQRPGEPLRVAVVYADAPDARRVAVVYADAPDARDAAAGARVQLALYGLEPTSQLAYAPEAFSATEAVRISMAGNPERIFFFGGPEELEKLAEHLAATYPHPVAIGALTLLSPTLDLPAVVASEMVLASPAEQVGEAQLAELVALLDRSGDRVTSPAFQAMAFAAARTLVEAMTRAGRQLGRASLTTELERLRGFETGVLPPVSFAPNRRVGLRGASIVRIDGTRKQYVPLTTWKIPQTGEIPR